MSITKKTDNAYLNQYTDNAIKRGYEIYDEWVDKKLDSRKIVASAHNAVKLFKKRKTMLALIEVLAYIFAIDTHIKEKYNSILRCLFSYFSWRRETRALESLKSALNISLGNIDIRDVIAVEIEKLAEKLDDEWDEDGDDETHGGKRNGKAEEELSSEEKDIDEKVEEKNEAEELDDKEEKEKDSEEKGEEPVEESPQEEAKEEIGENKETAEPQQEEVEITATEEKEELAQEKNENSKEENNAPDTESEPSTDKKEEAKTYNDAVDSPPLYEENASEHKAEKTSLIDEMIIDNMLKGDKNIIGNQRIDEAERNREANIPEDTVPSRNDESKSTDKDEYLYDNTLLNDKGETQEVGKSETTQQAEKTEATKQTEKTEATKQAEKVSEIKTDQPKEPIQNNDNVQSNEQKVESTREMLKVDISVEQENKVAYELNDTMSLESKMSIIRMKEEQLREHMSITLEELGMDDTSNILRVSEPAQPSLSRAVQSRK